MSSPARDGASSNPLPIYVHPVVTSVVLGTTVDRLFNDPATNCSPAGVRDTAGKLRDRSRHGVLHDPADLDIAHA